MGCTLSSYNNEIAKTPPFAQRPQRKSIHYDDKYFTERQKTLVRDTWHKVSNKQVDTGVQIFLKLFQLKPEAKQLFPFRNLEGDALLSNSLFRGHSMRFMFAIGSTVAHLDALDISCGPTFILLGRKHLWIRDFPESGYLDAFIESVAYVFDELLGESEQGEVYEAWQTVFRFVVGKMKEGYKLAEEEVKRKQSKTSETVSESGHISHSKSPGNEKSPEPAPHGNDGLNKTVSHGNQDTSKGEQNEKGDHIQTVPVGNEDKSNSVTSGNDEVSKTVLHGNEGTFKSLQPSNEDISKTLLNNKDYITNTENLNGLSKVHECPYTSESNSIRSHTPDNDTQHQINTKELEQRLNNVIGINDCNGQLNNVPDTHPNQHDNIL